MSLNLVALWGCGSIWGHRRKAQIGRLCSAKGVWDLVPPRKRGSCEPDVYVEGGAESLLAVPLPFWALPYFQAAP